MDDTLLLSAIVLLWGPMAALYLRAVGRRWWWASATNLTVAYYSLILWATYGVAVSGGPGGAEWVWAVLLATVAMLGGCLAAAHRRREATRDLAGAFWNRPQQEKPTRATWALLWCVTAVSVAVVVLFLHRLGGNVLLRSLGEGIGGVSSESVSDLRKRSVYGSAEGDGPYMAAGYVMQFRAHFLPIVMLTAMFIAVRASGRARRAGLALLVLSAAACLVANGATGQRWPLVLPFGLLTYLCLVGYYNGWTAMPAGHRRVLATVGLMSLALSVSLFVLLTIALGRAGSAGTAPGRAREVVVAGIERIAVIPAEYDARAVDLLEKHPPAMGRGWLRGLLMPLPNRLERRITKNWSPVGGPRWLHFQYGGSREGNAPLGRWGALWFDFRLPGMVIFGFLAGYLTHLYDRWCFRWRRSALDTVCWQWGAVSIALATSPDMLLLTGFAAAMLIAGADRLLNRPLGRPARQPAAGEAAG